MFGGFEIDDGDVAAGSLLNPDGLAGDPKPLAGRGISRLALAVCERSQGSAVLLCLSRKQWGGECQALHRWSLSVSDVGR